MDLAIEANRNSALFNTMQQVLDVYNPLLHKARPTIVNQTKHRIRCNPTRWGNVMDKWNGAQSVRFDLPRIGSLVDFTLKCSFRIPGVAPSDTQRRSKGDRGYAKTALTLGDITDNTTAVTNNARGRLDRLYADRLLGFNMIKSYTVSSKSRRIFSATGEYLLTRFSQMDEDMKKSVMDAITPIDPLAPDLDNGFYAPGVSYYMTIPLFMFFNEHITAALDVNFSEEVHIDLELRPPSQLFYYGQIGDLTEVPNALATGAYGQYQKYLTGDVAIAWDQAVSGVDFAVTGITSSTLVTTVTVADSSVVTAGCFVTIRGASLDVYNVTALVTGVPTGTTFTYNIADTAATPSGTIVGKKVLGFVSADLQLDESEIPTMQKYAQNHIQGIGAPFDQWGAGYGEVSENLISGPTFAYPDVDSLGESVQVQFEANADYIVQDTDAYRALRQQMFPEGGGLTTITYNTSNEVFQNLMNGDTISQNVLDTKSGGAFTDPAQSASGINIGDTSRFIDLPIRNNNLALATHFMVRKMSDMGGDGNTKSGNTVPIIGRDAPSNKIGAHRIYSRCIPIHYFQILAAGRVIYESDADSQLNLTQSGMYNGTGLEWGTKGTDYEKRNSAAIDPSRTTGKPFNIYSINHGLQASRLENSGSLSYQNLNNPNLRIFLKPDTWSEYCTANNTITGKSDALIAASQGLQVDMIHEYFNVVTINSGNGEITSGLNQ
jgi:hypothetical protein